MHILLNKNIDTETPLAKTPLIRAVEKGYLKITDELLKNKANV